MTILTDNDKCRIEVRLLLKEGKKEEAEKKCIGLDGEEWEDTLLCVSSSLLFIFIRFKIDYLGGVFFSIKGYESISEDS